MQYFDVALRLLISLSAILKSFDLTIKISRGFTQSLDLRCSVFGKELALNRRSKYKKLCDNSEKIRESYWTISCQGEFIDDIHAFIGRQKGGSEMQGTKIT